MQKHINKYYEKSLINILEDSKLDPFVLATEIVEKIGKSKQPYMIYENGEEISVALREHINIEVYKDRIILFENNKLKEYEVKNLSEDIKRIFNKIDFVDWRMYGIADFNYARNTFLNNLNSEEVLLKLFIPQIDIRISKKSIRVRSINKIDELLFQIKEIISKIEDFDINVDSRTLSSKNVEKTKDKDSVYYKDIVAKGIEEINNEKYDKVILSRKIKLDKRISMKNSYLTGRKFNTPARSYCLKIGEFEVIGFSPETVVEVNSEKEVYTFPLAGTRALTNDPKKNKKLRNELVKDPKEIAEHAVSVKLAFEELERVCLEESISVIKFMEVLERGSVQHLASRLKGTLKDDFNEWHAFTSLFPAVTASGIPKKECIDAIDRLEKDERGLYSGGVLTYDQDGTMDVALALRSAFQTEKETWIQVGAGIVKLSKVERELEETKEKVGSILDKLEYIEE